jgi:hypothetical protein
MLLPWLNNIFLCYIFPFSLPVASPKIISKTNWVTALRAAMSPFQMADPNTAYLGKWQLLKLDGTPFVATPVLQRKQPNNPATMSPVAASSSIQFNSAPMVTSVPQPGATDCLAAKSGSIQISNLAPSDLPEWDAPRQPNRCLPAL